jgi:hypothetical protein
MSGLLSSLKSQEHKSHTSVVDVMLSEAVNFAASNDSPLKEGMNFKSDFAAKPEVRLMTSTLLSLAFGGTSTSIL